MSEGSEKQAKRFMLEGDGVVLILSCHRVFTRADSLLPIGSPRSSISVPVNRVNFQPIGLLLNFNAIHVLPDRHERDEIGLQINDDKFRCVFIYVYGISRLSKMEEATFFVERKKFRIVKISLDYLIAHQSCEQRLACNNRWKKSGQKKGLNYRYSWH